MRKRVKQRKQQPIEREREREKKINLLKERGSGNKLLKERRREERTY